MVRRIGSIAAVLVSTVCLAACSAVETPGAQDSNGSPEQASLVVGLDLSKVEVLVADMDVPPWYSMDVGTDTPGEFSVGGCSSEVFYYPIRLQGDSKEAYGYFEPATVEELGDGILVSMTDSYKTGYIDKPYGMMVVIREMAHKIFSIDGFADYYFIPDAELGADPELAKKVTTEEVSEIGFCAYEELQ